MSKHHKAWLSDHPHRSEDWLRRIIAEGFEVHHIDGDHSNNHPKNLALIEIQDHRSLHGLFRLKDYSLKPRPPVKVPFHKIPLSFHQNLGRLGGLARRKKLSAAQRRLIAIRAAQARWQKPQTVAVAQPVVAENG